MTMTAEFKVITNDYTNETALYWIIKDSNGQPIIRHVKLFKRKFNLEKQKEKLRLELHTYVLRMSETLLPGPGNHPQETTELYDEVEAQARLDIFFDKPISDLPKVW